MLSFYHYTKRWTHPQSLEPKARLANIIHSDANFPKEATDFQTITDYIESQVEYSRFIVAFDDLWQEYQAEL